jgi:hypothetical protein
MRYPMVTSSSSVERRYGPRIADVSGWIAGFRGRRRL